MISGHDSAQLPSDMWRKIASYAYVSFREAGCGAVLVRQVDSSGKYVSRWLRTGLVSRKGGVRKYYFGVIKRLRYVRFLYSNLISTTDQPPILIHI